MTVSVADLNTAVTYAILAAEDAACSCGATEQDAPRHTPRCAQVIAWGLVLVAEAALKSHPSSSEEERAIATRGCESAAMELFKLGLAEPDKDLVIAALMRTASLRHIVFAARDFNLKLSNSPT